MVDPRDRRGIRHPLVSILALAAAAVVAGARSYVVAGQWAAHAPAGVLAVLEVRAHDQCAIASWLVPSSSTGWRPRSGSVRSSWTCDQHEVNFRSRKPVGGIGVGPVAGDQR